MAPAKMPIHSRAFLSPLDQYLFLFKVSVCLLGAWAHSGQAGIGFSNTCPSLSAFSCFGHLMRRTDSLEKTLMLGKTGGRRRRGNRGWDGWMASPTRWTWVWVNSGSWWWTGRPGVLWFMGFKESDTTEWLNGTELNWVIYWVCILYQILC